MDIPLTTELKDKAQELLTLREKQAEYFPAIKAEQDADKRATIKAQAEEGLREIEAKAKEYDDELAMHQADLANREAIKSMKAPNRTVPFSANGQQDAAGAGRTEDGAAQMDLRTLGQRIVADPAYAAGLQSYKSAPFTINVDDLSVKNLPNPADAAIKAAMTTATTWAPFGYRLPGYVGVAVRQPALRDLIPQDTTESPLFYYMEETTGPTGSNATYVAEGDSKPPMSLVVVSRTAEVAKIAANMQISEELLEDIPQFRSYVDNRGSLEMDLAEESALLNFTNGANKFDGFLQKAGVQTQAKGADPAPTAILKGMVKVQWSPGFAGMASGLAMNPVDWQNVLTLQESTGAYIWSAPSAPTEMPDMRMWGMTVRPVAALSAGTALLGNFRMFSMLWVRTGLSIRVAWANDDAIKNLVRLIFEMRETLVISRAAAFCKVSGL